MPKKKKKKNAASQPKNNKHLPDKRISRETEKRLKFHFQGMELEHSERERRRRDTAEENDL